MASTFKQIKHRRMAVRYGPRKRRATSSGLIERNDKMLEAWLRLQDTPSVAFSDPNRWRESPDVRPSQFPFCPRRYVFMRLSPPEPDAGSVRMNLYTEQGIAVHAVVQNAFGVKGWLWGLWTCARPTCGQLWSSEPSLSPMTKGQRCPKCNAKFFNYHELTLRDEELGLVAHTDGVLLRQNRLPSILEIKTSDEQKVKFIAAATNRDLDDLFYSTEPWFGYYHQAATYAVFARRRYPKVLSQLDRIEFLIQSRNKPQDAVAITVKVPDDMVWEKIRASVVMAQWAKKKRLLPMGFAREEADLTNHAACRWCGWRDVCLAKNGDGLVDCKGDALHHIETRKKLKTVRDAALDAATGRK